MDPHLFISAASIEANYYDSVLEGLVTGVGDRIQSRDGTEGVEIRAGCHIERGEVIFSKAPF